MHEVLHDLTQQPKLKKGLTQVRIRQAWKQTMGENVVRYTEQIQLRGQTLQVQLTSSALSEELQYGKEKILIHLNNELGFDAIKKIVFR